MPEAPLPADTTAEQDRASASQRLVTAVRPPETTSEQDRKTAGQRRVNIIWELTQSYVAIMVTTSTVVVAALTAKAAVEVNATVATVTASSTGFLLLSNAFFLVIGFYFGRTNHTRSGGIGGGEAGPR